MRCRADDDGVTPVVATLVLILVAVIGAITVAYLLGAFSTNISKQITPPQATSNPKLQVLIADTSETSNIDQLLAKQYMANNKDIEIDSQNTQDDFTGFTALNSKLVDIVALSKYPSPSLTYEYPDTKTYLIGSRAIVIIANSNMNIPSLSQSDLAKVYSQTQQNKPSNLSDLTTVVRNSDGLGSENIFAEWLTDDNASSLDGYMITPDGVQNYTASSESEVLSKVSSTPGAIGFVDWKFFSNSPSNSNVHIIPIVNKNNNLVQTPGDQAIRNEMACMNGSYYDDGLMGGLFYIIKNQTGKTESDYINWTRTYDLSSQFDNYYMYTASELDIS